MDSSNHTLWVPLLFLLLTGSSYQNTQAQTAATSDQETDRRKPNVVILFSDDAGYADFGFQPNCIPAFTKLTPNIDSLASAGARFSNAYMSGCVCSPSRAGLMTGRYQQRFGFDNNLPPGTQSGLELDETFGASRLRDLGYKTGLIGKWHLGYPEDYHPNRRGFDWFYGLLQGSRPYFPMKKPTPHRVIQENGIATEETGYVTDRLGDAAVKFIGENKAEPFFLFVSFTAPHGPLQSKEADLARAAGCKNPKYGGLIVSLDDNVGKILAALREHQLEDDTVVIFTNDNGGQTQLGANNTPLKGRKGMLTEGGTRVPWAVRWPGKITPGTVIDQPVIGIDIVPSLIEIAGGKDEAAWNLDGRSFVPLLDGESKLPTRTLFWRTGGSKGSIAARTGKWKFLHSSREDNPESFELYDLDSDLSESNNLAANHPKTVAEFQEKIAVWESEMEEPRWGKSRRKPKKQTR